MPIRRPNCFKSNSINQLRGRLAGTLLAYSGGRRSVKYEATHTPRQRVPAADAANDRRAQAPAPCPRGSDPASDQSHQAVFLGWRSVARTPHPLAYRKGAERSTSVSQFRMISICRGRLASSSRLMAKPFAVRGDVPVAVAGFAVVVRPFEHELGLARDSKLGAGLDVE